MSADTKKSMVKFYAVLLIICSAMIIIMFIIDVNTISPASKWFDYVKNILFGVFTGILTGLAITFYEYIKQIYFDFYYYIKQTNDCIKNIQRLILSKKYPLSIVQIESYRDTVKSSFMIRKLRKNNEQVVQIIRQIYENIDIIYENLNEAYKTSNSISLYNNQTSELYQQLLNKCSEVISEEARAEAFQKMRTDKAFIDKSLGVLDNSLENIVKNCERQLLKIENLNMELYSYVNSSHKIFIL